MLREPGARVVVDGARGREPDERGLGVRLLGLADELEAEAPSLVLEAYREIGQIKRRA